VAPGFAGGGPGISAVVEMLFKDNYTCIVLANTDGGITEELSPRIMSAIKGRHYPKPTLPPANYLYGILKKQGAAYLVSHFDQLPEEGGFCERHSGILNKAGYSLMSQGKADEAIEVFAVNVQLFPKEANPYDSLAEAYLKKGDKENALKYYKKALELDPEFPSAKRMAGELEGKE
jgi:tetratricopeptide (TPR) repeat protein